MLYTSGSTGEPKGAYLTEDGALHWARSVAEVLRLTPGDRTALVIPGSHAFGLASLLATFWSGGSVVLLEPGRSLEPLARAIAEQGVTVVHGSPAVFEGLLEAGVDLSGVRTGLVGGAASPPGLIERVERAGPRILNVFGMTEIGAAAACRLDDPPQARYETAGRAMPGYALQVVEGELQVRGQGVTPGYHGREPLGEAWFATGDVATIDADGWVRITGRASEVIHVGGFNVFPAEVESFLLTHPDVVQAAVIGAPHPRMGAVVKAFVVARPGTAPTSGELVRFARANIAGYKVPYGVEILPELPRLASGKVDKGAL